MGNIVILWDTAYDKGHLLKRHRKKHVGGGGGGYSTKCYTGSNPYYTGSNPVPFYVLILTGNVPFSYTFYWQMVPLSHTLSTTLYPFTYCKCTVFKLWIQITTFSRLFHSHKMHLLTLWTFLQTEMTYFPVLSYTSTRPVPFHIPEPWKKKVLLSGGASV